MIRVNDQLAIPLDELVFTASRSGGPGGQNVNKVSSRITLSFDVVNSPSLSPEQRARIAARLSTRINKDGILRINAQATRSQELNRADALERFAELLREALVVPKARKKTRVSRAAKERRLDEKKKRTGIKEGRTRKEWD